MKKTILNLLTTCLYVLAPVFAMESYYEESYLKSVDQQQLRSEISDALKNANVIIPQWEQAAKKNEVLSQRLRIFRRLISYIEESTKAPNQPDGLLHARRGAMELRMFTEYFLEQQQKQSSSALPLKQWNVKDFGAKGDGKSDDAPAFQRMLDEIARHPEFQHKAKIPAGTYLFNTITKGDNSAIIDVMSKERKKSLLLRSIEKAHLRLKNLKNVTLQGEGEVHILFGDSTDCYGIRIDGCENVKIENLKIDYKNLPFTQGTIVALNPQKNSFTMKKDLGYPDPDIEQFIKPNSRRLWSFDPQTKDFIWNSGTKFLGRVNSMGNNLFEVEIRRSTRRLRPLEGLEIGRKVGIIARYNGTSAAVAVAFSKSTVISNVSIYSSPGLAFTSPLSSDSHFIDCKIQAKPGTDRLVSTNGDGLQANANFIGPVVMNCNFSRMYDDSVMITSRSLEINTIFEAGKKADISSWLFFDGAECALINSENGKVKLETTCQMHFTSPQPPRKIILTFAQPLPNAIPKLQNLTDAEKLNYFNGGKQDAKFGDTLLCLSRSNIGAVVTGNSFGPNHGHGINMQAPNSLIENNIINGVESSGIMISTLSSWYETLVPHNVLIANNEVKKSGASLVTFFQLSNRKNSSTIAPIRFLTVKNNTFTAPQNLALRLCNVSGATFENNMFSETNKKPFLTQCNENIKGLPPF